MLICNSKTLGDIMKDTVTKRLLQWKTDIVKRIKTFYNRISSRYFGKKYKQNTNFQCNIKRRNIITYKKQLKLQFNNQRKNPLCKQTCKTPVLHACTLDSHLSRQVFTNATETPVCTKYNYHWPALRNNFFATSTVFVLATWGFFTVGSYWWKTYSNLKLIPVVHYG